MDKTKLLLIEDQGLLLDGLTLSLEAKRKISNEWQLVCNGNNMV